MLKSLFGELGTVGGHREPDGHRPGDFAATAILESRSSEISEQGQLLDRHTQDLFVTGSPAEAMRQHLATLAKADTEAEGVPSHTLTLYDPSRMWAGAVVKALSDASGRAIERLHLRDQATLATLAMIERTTLPRRGEATLKIYHADLRDALSDSTEVPLALMENSNMAAIIVGPMHSSLLDAMLATLLGAVRSPHWRSATLLFMLPVGAPWIERKIRSVPWPRSLQVRTIAESLSSASTVWNLLLSEWNAVQAAALATPAVTVLDTGNTATALTASESAAASMSGATVRDISRRDPDELTVMRAMREVTLPDGVIGATLVNITRGSLVATEGGGTLDMELAAASATDLMRTHHRATRYYTATGSVASVDEVIATAGPRQMLLRTVDAHPHLFLMVIADRQRANLDDVRAKLFQAQQMLI